MITVSELVLMVQDLNHKMADVGDGAIRLYPFELVTNGDKHVVKFMGGYDLWDSEEDDEDGMTREKMLAHVQDELENVLAIMRQVDTVALVRDSRPESPLCGW